jgi:hypothetical protein
MSTRGRTWTKATAVCPRPGHAGSRVSFGGQYGPVQHRRQLYRCAPSNGDAPHRFAEQLPREESWLAACDACERPVASHEGPQAARQYHFVARGIAGALHSVGAGMSYREAALVARERARRLRIDPGTGDEVRSRHGSLVMDWVEVFAPVVFEPRRQNDWPATGSLLLDDLPFRVRDPTTGRSKVAFRIFCAMGYVRMQPVLWHIQAYTDKRQLSWENFLGGLGGAPQRVVCDNDGGMTAAVRGLFPQAELYLCEWHLKHAFNRLLNTIDKEEPQYRRETACIRPRVDAGFTGPNFWAPFAHAARLENVPRVTSWLDTTGLILEDQWRRRGLRSTRPRDMPLTTSPMDALIHPIRDALHTRRYALKNQERLNRLLMLMVLRANRQDNVHTYTKNIRQWLEANDGRPRTTRRAIVDSGGHSSLRR